MKFSNDFNKVVLYMVHKWIHLSHSYKNVRYQFVNNVLSHFNKMI